MAKNRKRRADAVRFRQMAKILLLAGACAAVGLGYVWQKKQLYRLGRELKQRETAVEDAKRRNMLLVARVAELKSPAALEERIRALRINLAPPKDSQVIRLPEPTGAPMPSVASVPAQTVAANRAQTQTRTAPRPTTATRAVSTRTLKRPR
jgi:cell division protein FtsL